MTALARCVGDVTGFLADHWGKRAHLWRQSGLERLLRLDDADAVLSTMAPRAPAFRVVKDGVTVDPSSYTRSARIGSRTVTDLIDVGRVFHHFDDGATIVLQGLHRYWPPVAEVCRELEEELTHPLQANAYISPPVAQGLRAHVDGHDVFAVQTHGRKQWVVDQPELDVELEAGDCLYVPKGVRHAARTVDSPSIHLTLGVRRVTWADVVARVLDKAAHEQLLDEALPAGFARRPERLVGQAAQRLATVAAGLSDADPGEALAELARRFWTGRPPALAGQLPQLLAVDGVDDGTPLRRRPHATCVLDQAGDTVELVLGDRSLRMPAVAGPALRRVIDLVELKPADLGDLLDEQSRVTLARRLVREGLLMVVHG